MLDQSERSGGTSKVLAVAWREFKHTALTKAFFFGAVVVPLLVFAVIAIAPALMRQDTPPLKGTVAIVDPTGLVAPLATKDFASITERGGVRDFVKNATVPTPDAADPTKVAGQMADVMAGAQTVEISVESTRDPADIDALRERLRRNELLALAIIDPKLLTSTPGDAKLELLVPTGSSPTHTDIYIDILRDVTVRARVEASGADFGSLSALLAKPRIDTQRVSKEGATAKERLEARMIIPIGFMMLIWICTFSSGNYLLTSTIEEKSNKVMEVLLSAISPMQLLFGKILGQAFVSLVMLVIYGGVAIAGIVALRMMDLISTSLVVYMLLYFIMAYFMIATIMTAVGSAVSDLREAQALIGPAMLVLMVPLMLWLPISQNPNGMLSTITSFIPPLIPFVMILRVSTSTEPVAFWQVLLSLVFGFGATVGMLWLAARIFRVGVLMQGKPPSPMELLRWASYK